MGDDNYEFTVLLHESEQVTALIERLQTTANTLFGAVVPGAIALLLFAPKVGDVRVPAELLAVFFTAIVTLALIFNAGLWVEITRYMRYKYLVLFPKIYEVAGLSEKESLGHFLAVQHLQKRDFLGMLFQSIALLVPVTISMWIVVEHATEPVVRTLLLLIIVVLAASAAIANLYLGRLVREALEEIAAQRPKVG